jgi:hypothetical protein
MLSELGAPINLWHFFISYNRRHHVSIFELNPSYRHHSRLIPTLEMFVTAL